MIKQKEKGRRREGERGLENDKAEREGEEKGRRKRIRE